MIIKVRKHTMTVIVYMIHKERIYNIAGNIARIELFFFPNKYKWCKYIISKK